MTTQETIPETGQTEPETEEETKRDMLRIWPGEDDLREAEEAWSNWHRTARLLRTFVRESGRPETRQLDEGIALHHRMRYAMRKEALRLETAVARCARGPDTTVNLAPLESAVRLNHAHQHAGASVPNEEKNESAREMRTLEEQAIDDAVAVVEQAGQRVTRDEEAWIRAKILHFAFAVDEDEGNRTGTGHESTQAGNGEEAPPASDEPVIEAHHAVQTVVWELRRRNTPRTRDTGTQETRPSAEA